MVAITLDKVDINGTNYTLGPKTSLALNSYLFLRHD